MYEGWVTSNGIKLIPSFAKISQFTDSIVRMEEQRHAHTRHGELKVCFFPSDSGRQGKSRPSQHSKHVHYTDKRVNVLPYS